MSAERRLFDRVWAAVDELVAEPSPDGAGAAPEILRVRRSESVLVTISDDGTDIEAACIDGWGWVVLGADGGTVQPVNTCAFAERLDPRVPEVLDRFLGHGGPEPS